VVVQADIDGERLVGASRLRCDSTVDRHRRRRHQDTHLGTHVAQTQLSIVLSEPHPRQRLLRDPRLRRRDGQQTSPARHRGTVADDVLANK